MPEKLALLRAFDVPAMDRVVAICTWGRSGSLLLSSFLDGHEHVVMLPALHGERIYDFFDAYRDLPLREKLLAYPVFAEADSPTRPGDHFFSGEFAIGAGGYCAAIEALLQVYGDRSPEFLASSRTFFQFLHVAYALALGRHPAVPRPIMVHAQHRVWEQLSRRLVDDFPDARFLHSVRDPISCFDSSLIFNVRREIRLRQREPALYPMSPWDSLRWLARSDAPNPGMEARTRAVRFEDLHLRTEPTMRGVAEWLGIPYRLSLVSSTYNGAPWVFTRDGMSWSGARPEQAQRQSSNLSFIDRALIFALFHDNFVAWHYPYPSGFSRRWLRRLVQAALWVVPTKAEMTTVRVSVAFQVVPCWRDGAYRGAIRTILRLLARHVELARGAGVEFDRRLSGSHGVLNLLETIEK
ncbi:MAG TPA: sulfotransferase [Stellaceae bacterium]|nr:sulfotransferase [Stellaceae bacterium]